MGGDWYDAFTLPDGRLVLVVGDVMGKGVVAAAGMGRLRAALRALALVNPLPEAVLTGLDRVFTATEEPDQIATLVYLLINPAPGGRRSAAPGICRSCWCGPGGEPELVDAGSGSTPLGWPEPRTQRTLELGPGDLLLGVTDGRRRAARLRPRRGARRAASPACGAPGRASTILWSGSTTTMLGRTLGRDDATLLAVRFVS